MDACVRTGDIDAARVQQREVNPLTECAEASLVPYDQDEGSFFKVYLADTGLMFYKLAVNPRLWLESQGTAPASSDFRGALAENSVMQALASNDLQTYYWVPPASWGGRGELDFLLQDDQARVIPVEVKSARNVRARTLSMSSSAPERPMPSSFRSTILGSSSTRGERRFACSPCTRHTASGKVSCEPIPRGTRLAGCRAILDSATESPGEKNAALRRDGPWSGVRCSPGVCRAARDSISAAGPATGGEPAHFLL